MFRRPCTLLAALIFAVTAQAQILRLPCCITVQQPQTEATPEHHMTPEEAKELLGSVDTILKFDSQDTGLALKRSVKGQLASRDQVQNYIEKRMKDNEDAQRLQRAEIVLQKFGLLPRDFNLQQFLVTLLREQVAGYYDPDTKTMYLLDWLDPEQQKPVMAHELTHALQDQNFGMKKWMKENRQDGSPSDDVNGDEQTAARTAVVEGQAMTVMVDYLLEPAGKSVMDSPSIVDAIEAGMTGGATTPIYNTAPLYLKSLLIFPYTHGLNFTRALLENGGKKRAYEQVFKEPPQDTRHIMQPSTYLAGQKIPEVKVPDLVKSMSGYERYDVGSIGEFDTDVIVSTYSKKDENKKLAQSWRGGWYYALHKKDQPAAAGNVGLVYVSRWADKASATQFAKMYAAYVPMRYAGASSSDGGSSWQSPEGPVVISQQNDTVTAIEGFDPASVAKLRSVLGIATQQ